MMLKEKGNPDKYCRRAAVHEPFKSIQRKHICKPVPQGS